MGRAAMRAAARGAWRSSRARAAGRWTWPWRPPRRASSPSAGWCAAARLARRARAGAAAAQPPRRAAVSRGRAAAGVAFADVVTRTRGEQHRKCAATGAQKADSVCSSSVLLGVSLARRLRVRNLLFPRRGTSTGARRCLCHMRRQPGRVRLPRKLFLNPAPLGCHHHLHLSRLSTLALAVSMRVGAGDIRRLCC